MTERQPNLYIEDILSSIEAIEKYTKGLSTWQEFRDNKMVFDAVVRNFEIIGEAARKLIMILKIDESETEDQTKNGMPWPQIIGLRNKIAHEYFGIDAGTIWRTIQDDLPSLKKHTEEMKNAL